MAITGARAGITAADITRALEELGVDPARPLMVHSSVRDCLKVSGASVAEKLDTVLRGLDDGVPNGALVLPTFTYSFCSGEPFSVTGTPSTVGALTEHFRRRPGVRRTTDPLFSVAVRGRVPDEWETRLFTVRDVDCFGDESVFALMRELGAGVLFFGVSLQSCTFVHHIEQRHSVPYRYKKDFAGVIELAGRRAPVTASYFVRPLDGTVEPHLAPLEDALLERGRARALTLPHGPRLLFTDTTSIEAVILEEMDANPDFLLLRGHETPATGAVA